MVGRLQRISYNSCRNRHCPKCQNLERTRWLERRQSELLPVPYFHVVFTIPEQLHALALRNKATVYGILFQASAQTLVTIAADPRHLGARIGFFSVLHTWGQNLLLHPHVHCVVTGGGLSPDGQRWIGCRPGFFLSVRVLSRLFRRLFLEALQRAFDRRQLEQPGELKTLVALLSKREWVVYAKPPFGGPAQVLDYLGRYTHRVAISNNRLLGMDGEQVRFRYKNYRAKHQQRPRTMTLPAAEFIRRFLLHTIPPGFQRIRHYGLLASRQKQANLARCRLLLTRDTASRSDPSFVHPGPRWPGSADTVSPLPGLRGRSNAESGSPAASPAPPQGDQLLMSRATPLLGPNTTPNRAATPHPPLPASLPPRHRSTAALPIPRTPHPVQQTP